MALMKDRLDCNLILVSTEGRNGGHGSVGAGNGGTVIPAEKRRTGSIRNIKRRVNGRKQDNREQG